MSWFPNIENSPVYAIHFVAQSYKIAESGSNSSFLEPAQSKIILNLLLNFKYVQNHCSNYCNSGGYVRMTFSPMLSWKNGGYDDEWISLYVPALKREESERRRTRYFRSCSSCSSKIYCAKEALKLLKLICWFAQQPHPDFVFPATKEYSVR